MEWRSIQDVLNSTLVVHRLSPLHNFLTSPSALRSYSAELLAAITFNGQMDMADTADASLLQLEDAGDACGIGIAVSLPGKDAPLRGVLYGDEDWSATGDNFAVLPLLLTKGPLDDWQGILQWLQGRFDCCVAPLKIPPFRLTGIATDWMTMSAGGSQPIELSFKLTRAAVPGIKHITVTFAAESIHRLQLSIAQAGSSADKQEQELQLMQALEAHFASHFHLSLSEAQLVRVGCSAAILSTEGKLKLNQEASCLRVLSDLASMSSLNAA